MGWTVGHSAKLRTKDKTRSHIRVLDNLSTRRAENLAEVFDRITCCAADIRNLESIKPYFEDADYVIHLAALPSVPRSIADPLTTNAVNIDGTLNVLMGACEAGVKRVVFAGWSSAYGGNPALPRLECREPHPLSSYALTKLTGTGQSPC